MSAKIAVPTIGDIVRGHAAARPDAVALRFEDRAWTYAEVDRRSNRVANSLIRDRLTPGTRVAFLSRNTDDIATITVGAAKAGLIFVPINPRLAPPEIDYIVRNCGASVLFFGDGFAATAAALAEGIGGLALVGVDPLAGSDPWLSSDDGDPAVPVDPRDVAVLIYTSGTTGRPKGAMLSHYALSAINALRKSSVPWDTWGPDDVALQALPLAHVGGFSVLLRALYFGAQGVILREFDAGKVLDAIADCGISKIGLVPTAIAALLDHPRVRDIDYSRIDTIFYGASPIQVELLKQAVAVFGTGFAQSYGMTETSSAVVTLTPDDHRDPASPLLRSAGRALPGTELRVFDGEGAALPPSTVGEVAIRSVANMAGYWNDDAATAETIDADGWLRTGDAGYLDADGYLFIQDRIKDVIISGASNIYPAEVESAIFGHPDVAQVAVIGVPDDRWGESVKAVVVAKPGHVIDPQSVIDWSRDRIASYKIPRSVDIVAALPLNATGKVQRRALRAPYWEGRARQV